MMLYAGFDEAGYGPLLGPLCVASSALLVPDGDPATPPDMWQALAAGVCTTRKDRRGRVAICDSKALKGSRDSKAHPLHAIERGVLAAMATLHGTCPADEDALDALLAAHLPMQGECRRPLMGADAGSRAIHVTCESPGSALPCALTPDDVQVAASLLRRTCAAAGISLCAIACVAITPAQINADAQRGLTKPSIPFSRAAQMAVRLLESHPQFPVRLAFDRQGGRMRYGDDLRRSFDCSRLVVLHEDEERSAYRFESGHRTVVASFETGGESRHLPVALASMVAKYVRELRMSRLNRFFAQYAPDVAPTAGYVTDGRRYLAEIAPHLDALGIDRTGLVRSI